MSRLRYFSFLSNTFSKNKGNYIYQQNLLDNKGGQRSLPPFAQMFIGFDYFAEIKIFLMFFRSSALDFGMMVSRAFRTGQYLSKLQLRLFIFEAYLKMVFIQEVKMKASMAYFKDYQLKYCSNYGNQQFRLQSWLYFLPQGSVYLRVISPLKNGFFVFLFSFRRIKPPQVRTEPFTISISEGNVDFSLLITKSSVSPLKLLYKRTLSESGAPKTSKLLMSSDFSAMLTSQAEGKYPKSKVSKTYFLISSCLTAQKQLKPFTSFKHSQTYDRNSLEMPMIVKFMPAVFDTSSMNAFSLEMLLSQTSVNIMILFQLGHFWLASVQPFSKATDSQNPDRMVVPPLTLILSNLWQISSGNSDFSIGQKMISAELLKVIKLTLSFGLSLEMNILIASTDNAKRDL